MNIRGTVFEVTDLNRFVEEIVGLLSKSKLSSGSKKRSLLGAGGLVAEKGESILAGDSVFHF